MQSTHRVILIIATLLFAYLCLSRHSMFESHRSGLLTAISALLAVGSLQPSSSVASRVSPASLQLIRLVTPLLVGAALVGQHAAEAKLQVVTNANFKDSPYYGSPVSLKGEDVSVTLNERASQVNVTWEFASDWHIELEKCDVIDTVEFEISDSCKWKFDWNDTQSFQFLGFEPVDFEEGFDPPPPIRKLRFDIENTSLGVCAVTDEGDWGELYYSLLPPDHCMLSPNPFSVTITNTAPACPINVTIINARLLYDGPEPTTTVPPTTVIQSYTSGVNVKLLTTRAITTTDTPTTTTPTTTDTRTATVEPTSSKTPVDKSATSSEPGPSTTPHMSRSDLTTAGTHADDESTSSATMNSGSQDSTTNAGSAVPASASSTLGSSSSSSAAAGSETDVPSTLTSGANSMINTTASTSLRNKTTGPATGNSSLPESTTGPPADGKIIWYAVLGVGSAGFVISLALFVLAFLGIVCASKPPVAAVPQELDKTLV